MALVLIFCTFGSFRALDYQFRFNDKDDKDSKAEAYSKPCKTSKITLFTKIAYYLSS